MCVKTVLLKGCVCVCIEKPVFLKGVCVCVCVHALKGSSCNHSAYSGGFFWGVRIVSRNWQGDRHFGQGQKKNAVVFWTPLKRRMFK